MKVLIIVLILIATIEAQDDMKDACVKSIYYPKKSFTQDESQEHSRMLGIADGYLLANNVNLDKSMEYWRLFNFACKDALSNNTDKSFHIKYRKSIKKIAKEFYGY
jgi:hypothetical protein